MLNYGDPVLIYDKKGYSWIIFLYEDGILHTHSGIIRHRDIVGKQYGEKIKTHLGKEFWILKPTIEDFINNYIERKTQIVYPKDSGFLIIRSGIKSGDIILEVGTGSGALTAVLANIVRPTGYVDTYEKRKEFYQIAIKNLAKLKLDKYINFFNLDFKEATLKEEFYDAAFIDIDSPWEILDKVWLSLKGGGFASFIIPTYTQLEKLAPKLIEKFIDIKGQEVFYREIKLSPGRVRPPFRMIGYTAVLVTCRKIKS